MFCESDQLREKVNTLCYVQKMASFSPRVLRVIAMACEQRVREIIEKAVIISGHRNDIFKGKLMSVKRGSFDVRRAIRLLEIRDKEVLCASSSVTAREGLISFHLSPYF